jgi:hypothetical protein
MKSLAITFAAIPIAGGILASILYFVQGGFGAGHGRFDFWIGCLGLPSILLLEYLPIPDFVPDFVAIIWLPSIINAILFGLVGSAVSACRVGRMS